MPVRDSTESPPGIEAVFGVLRTGLSFGRSFLRWFVVLNIATGWIAMSANLVRIHLAAADTVAAAITVAVLLGPIVGVVLWSLSSRIGPGSRDIDPVSS